MGGRPHAIAAPYFAMKNLFIYLKFSAKKMGATCQMLLTQKGEKKAIKTRKKNKWTKRGKI